MRLDTSPDQIGRLHSVHNKIVDIKFSAHDAFL